MKPTLINSSESNSNALMKNYFTYLVTMGCGFFCKSDNFGMNNRKRLPDARLFSAYYNLMLNCNYSVQLLLPH